MDKRLGKGLDALIPDNPNKERGKIDKIKVAEISPNKFQPRKTFKQGKMEELLSSIQEKGVIQPILVRPSDKGYEIIAGERRWRAAQELNVEEIPAIIMKDISDASSLEISLIENIQRDELNPIEEANAYQELISKFEYTLDKVSQMVGKDKTTVSNSMRLLNLPDEIQAYLQDGTITTGHAKALLSIANERRRRRLAEDIVKKGFSVREAEHRAKQSQDIRVKSKKQKDPEIAHLEEQLQHYFGTKVNIQQGKKRGRIEIQYYSNDDLQRLLGLMLGNNMLDKSELN